ncbi:D-alanyl-D-alanine carboxypeptidase/D-alanyl-D-alanine-endopeptidase [uncultured Pseudokineococcus sp.]|uniref:D-alanyl-D-alanine carboxypeptidase/D-alanyl-D-alanine endopeptidase n=1 Tax=uncultured Pseudokineococcus sp. TaxID=1642928 RepID=UPI002610A219|nr:D-alanyl-D-alanine carboxypeptidase/D-alanyl-D-alanine-endopeptidase [uncultured Pseudokineococcus sp.]
MPRRGPRRARRAAGATVLVLALAGGYAAADAADVVPGPLTTAPPPVADPWPDAPGALVPASPPGPVLPAAGRQAPAPEPGRLREVLGPLLAAPALGPSRSAVVADALTGEVLLDERAGEPHQPASTAKLLTAAAALSVLGGASTLPTSVVLGAPEGEPEDAEGGGDGGAAPVVVLVAGGDVLLGAGAGDPAAVVGRAGLADLADEVAASLAGGADGGTAGAPAVRLRVADPLAPTGPVRPPTWTPGDVALGFAADVTGVAVDAGRLTPDEYAPRAPDPALAAADALADLLRARGVDVVGEARRTDPALVPAGAPVLGEVRSAPVADVVEHVLRVSDNSGAEVLGLLVARASGAPVTPEGATSAVRDAVAERGVAVDGVALTDSSGLGDGSALTARALVDVLGRAAREEELRPLLEGLPVAGLTGSLAARLGDEPAARGVVRAKTGTLTGVTSLAGVVVDADGRLLAFAVLADAVPATEPARAAVDDVAAALAACGCR